MPRKHPKPEPGDVFGTWTVLHDLPTDKQGRVMFYCRCKCGNEAAVREDNLRRYPESCQQCKSTFHSIYAKTASPHKALQHSYVYQAWIDMRTKNGATHILAWDEFEPFLAWFLEASQTQLEDHLKGRVSWSYYHIQRLNTALPWGPENAVVVKFVTERAFDERTYKYWYKLKTRNLLTDELAESYILFLNTFGNRERGYVLRRKSIRQPHSRDNSSWVNRSKEYIKEPNSGEPEEQ
jgi:hypothetical protein